ncbi:hypothetical protein AB1Y20_014498 [Prymnesium parvum]|uniref:CHCH domain-containing protein n=1 Tax=Prymnesium parvum TaxID=97485 RepID=A0AB34ID85_PRYPA
MASFASVPARGLPAKPPDKGSFPLDHFRECSEAKEAYMACLKEHMMQAQTGACRELSAAYLQCRMDAKLMAKQEMDKLGYYPSAEGSTSTPPVPDFDGRSREKRGFVAGTRSDL